MKDFFSTSIKTNLSQEDIYSIVSKNLPEFSWRMGDSDSQGLFISGNGKNTEQIQLWLDENLVDVTISLRNVKTDDSNRDEWKKNLINKILISVLPNIGEIGDVDITD